MGVVSWQQMKQVVQCPEDGLCSEAFSRSYTCENGFALDCRVPWVGCDCICHKFCPVQAAQFRIVCGSLVPDDHTPAVHVHVTKQPRTKQPLISLHLEHHTVCGCGFVVHHALLFKPTLVS